MEMPKEHEKMKLMHHFKEEKFPFVIYADFDNNLPRDTYHVLTTCIAVVSTNKQNSLLSLSSGCHKDDTHKSGPNTGAWFKSEKNHGSGATVIHSLVSGEWSPATG